MMKTKRKRSRALLSMLLTALILTALFMPTGYAAGEIDTGRDACLHILYQNGEMLLEGAEFSVYPVAYVDEYAKLSVTDMFSGYPIDFEEIDQEGWRALAVTLKGYALRDGLEACAVQKTDARGRADITVTPGLYLVFAKPVTVEDGDTYFSDPFMVHLPVRDAKTNKWIYETNARPKNTNYTTVRKVLKIWDDEGYETVRPERITVDLLCDGEICETVELSAENDWRCDWGELDPKHEWLVVERVPEGYYAVTDLNGKVYTVTNKFVAPVSGDEIIVQKKITGENPPVGARFTFSLTALEKGNPMPVGAKGDAASVSIEGAGSVSFGRIKFEKPGVYSYELREKNSGRSGWTYDTSVYTVTFTVTEKEGVLNVERTIRKDDAYTRVIEFTNPYKKPEERLPQTGLLWWPVPALVLLGLVLIVLGTVRRKEDDYER